MSQLKPIDYVIFLLYFVGVSSYGYWIFKQKQTIKLNTKDFFLDIFAGFSAIMHDADDHFQMIFEKPGLYTRSSWIWHVLLSFVKNFGMRLLPIYP